MPDNLLFAAPKERLAWGIEALADFQREADVCCETWVGETRVEIDPKTGEEVVNYRLQADLSSRLHRRANETIEAVKHAFDQAMFAACKSIVQGIRPNDKIGFPWAETEKGLRAILSSRNSRIPVELHAAILRLKPYGTGDGCTVNDDIARKLAQIANRKHSVGLTVSLGLHRMSSPPLGIQLTGPPIQLPTIHIPPKWDPMKKEMEIMRGPRGYGAYIQDNAQVAFCITLDEAIPLKNVPFSSAMGCFATKAQAVIETLEREVMALKS